MITTRQLPTYAVAATFVLLGGCNSHEAEPVADDARAVTETPAAAMPRSVSPVGARVFFIKPQDGDTVSNPVAIEFGIEGMNVVAAGVEETRSGHHHLLVDTDLPDMGMPIPADANHIHFGNASTSTALDLAPGQHTLSLLLGDHLHIPHDPPVVSDPITITVE